VVFKYRNFLGKCQGTGLLYRYFHFFKICHKNSVFTELFSEKSNLLELYNAVSGKNYPKDTEIRIITLLGYLTATRIVWELALITYIPV